MMNKSETLSIKTEEEKLAKAQQPSKPSSAHSAPDISVKSSPLRQVEPRSISSDGQRPPPVK